MALPLVMFPDMEPWTTAYLRAALSARAEPYASGVFVSTSVPDPARARMVIIRRDGGRRLGPALESARISARVWAATEADTRLLAGLVRALLHNATEATGPVQRVIDQSGPSAVPDESGQPQRLLYVEFIVRGTALST